MAVVERRSAARAIAPAAPATGVLARPSFFLWFAFLGLFILILPREFAGAHSPAPGRIYQLVGGGFRLIDLIVLGVFTLVLVVRVGAGRLYKLHVPRTVGIWACLFAAAILISMVHGALGGGTELFFDWRGMAIGVAFMFVIYQLVRAHESGARLAAMALVFALAVRAAQALFYFVAGVSDIMVLGVRVPAFDGPTLSNTVFLLIATSCLAIGWRDRSPNQRILLSVAAMLSLLLVMLAFRRTYWGEAVLGLMAIVLVFNKKRASAALVLVTLGVVALPFLPANFAIRAASLNLFATKSQNQYAVTNEDHLNDLRDAWDVIKKDPVLGYGLGRPYETERIEQWKYVSWGVHNAVLHVWLRYGALGLVSYLALHGATLRWLVRLSRRFEEGTFERWWLIATFSYLTATFLVSLIASPWPYGATQNSLLMIGLLGVAFGLQHQADAADRRAGLPRAERWPLRPA